MDADTIEDISSALNGLPFNSISIVNELQKFDSNEITKDLKVWIKTWKY
jgi:hypothetical protein